MVSSSKKIGVLAGAALSLYASSAFARDRVETDTVYWLDHYQITEFTSKTEPNRACAVAYYSGRFATDCFEKDEEGTTAEGQLLAAYQTSNGYYVTEFIPATAPDTRCTIINYTDRSSMNCHPQP